MARIAEGLDQSLREDGPDALDHARSEVFLNAGDDGGVGFLGRRLPI
jgi:hypothetical protein